MAGEDLDSSLIVPLIKRTEPEGAGGSSPLSWPEGDTPIAEELTGELYVFYGFDLPGAFRLVSQRDCARMQLAAGDLRPLAVRNLTRRRARPQIKQAPAAAMFVLDGNLESSLLLVDHLWEQIDPQRGMAAIRDSPAHQIAAHPARAILAATPRCRAAIDPLAGAWADRPAGTIRGVAAGTT